MTAVQVVVDTSVLVKWFHSEDETEVDEAPMMRDAHRKRLVTAYVLDLTLYELGNVLLGPLGWNPGRATDLIDVVLVICGPPLVPAPAWRRDAASLAAEHRLSFYDASLAAAARAIRASLVSTDKKLLAAGLAVSPTQFVTEHAHHIRNTP